jgi:hypothetical protein
MIWAKNITFHLEKYLHVRKILTGVDLLRGVSICALSQ